MNSYSKSVSAISRIPISFHYTIIYSEPLTHPYENDHTTTIFRFEEMITFRSGSFSYNKHRSLTFLILRAPPFFIGNDIELRILALEPNAENVVSTYSFFLFKLFST